MLKMFKLSNQAENDLNNIWLYTFENWSLKQADKYYNEIKLSVLKLSSNPELGRLKLTTRTKYFVYKINSHKIFYTKEDYGIFIVRIYHKSMDHGSILP